MEKGLSVLAFILSLLALTFSLMGVSVLEYSDKGTFAPYPVLEYDCYPSLAISGHWTQDAVTDGVLYCELYVIPCRAHVSKLSFWVYVAGDFSSACRLGLYSDKEGYPDVLIIDAGVVDCTTTGLKSKNVDVWIDGGYYYFALLFGGSFTQAPKLAHTTAVLTHVVGATRWTKNYAYGVLPNPYPSGGSYSLLNWGVKLTLDALD